MFSKSCFGAVSIIFLIYFAAEVKSLDKNVTIPLNKTLAKFNKELYGDYFHVENLSTLRINFENVNENVSFIIFQVHSHLHSVWVHNGTFIGIHGTNIGLYSSVGPNNTDLDSFYVVNSNENIDLKLYISVHGYKASDPVPAGCNMEFPLPTSSYVRSRYNKDFVTIDAASPKKTSDANCMDISNMIVYFYMLYLPERDFGPDAYFNGIKTMSTYESILANGKLVPTYNQFWRMKRQITAYPGTGAVYVAIAQSVGVGYSVYAPSYSYSCSPLEDGDCELIKDELSKVLCASLLFIGVFMCYLGHRFFKTEMFFIGFSSGFLITYIMISLIVVIDRPALIAASALSGIFYGLGWLMFWWLYGIPVFSVLLSSLNLGFLLSSIIYYALPADSDLLRNDMYFWSFFVVMMLVTALMIVLATFLGNILCCSVLGACATVYPIDLYIGSNLKYILINTLRRALVPEFNKVLLMPTFQDKDICVVVLWVTLVVSGVIFQYYYNRNKPPFPPPPRSVRPEPPMYGTDDRSRERVDVAPNDSRNYDERTPLLG